MASFITHAGTSVAPGTRAGFLGAVSWHSLGRRIVAWRLRSHSRQELSNLSDEELRDIGLSRPTTTLDAVKPIWMP